MVSEMMTAEELKASILQMAMQGKLVEQRPEEGNAEELYKTLIEHQRQYIKGGKIRTKNLLGKITEEEITFDIPPTWRWARIEECGYFISGYTPKPAQLSDNGVIPHFKVSDMNTSGNEKYLIITSKYLSDSVKCPKIFKKNTIVYPKNGGAVFTNKKRILSQDSVVDLNTGGFKPDESLSFNYIFMILSTIDFRKCYKGTALPTVDMDKLRRTLVPLPPLSEQKRIVAKLEELMPLVNQYAAASEKLNKLNASFPDQLKKSILQLAVQGKLVPQDPSDEPASELLKKIATEKQKLIQEGKIKKQKKLPAITEDEIPFEIPQSWAFCRLGSIIDLLSGVDFPPSGYSDVSGETVYITGASCLSEDGVIQQRWTDTPSKLAYKGDLLLVCKGSGYGKTAFCDVDKAHIARQIMAIKKITCLDLHYVRYFLQSRISSIKKSGQGIIPGIDRNKVLNMVFPLPPLNEQKRIVKRVDEMMRLISRMSQ